MQRASDIGLLCAAHPHWAFTSIWISAASGPDFRIIAASREGIQVQARTEAELSAQIADMEAVNGWSCG